MSTLLKINPGVLRKGYTALFFLYLYSIVPCPAQVKTLSMGDFPLENNQTIKNCELGYMTFGKLNADKSNAILFPTWYGGTSKDLAPYIGPGQMIDSTKFFVIVVDAFGDGVSSSPSNSVTQSNDLFPEFTIKDMIEAQHSLITNHLNISHLYAITGISMGGIQTYQWMASYPAFFDKAIPILGSPKLSSYDLLTFDILKRIMSSPDKPNTNLKQTALMLEYLLGFTPKFRQEETPAEDYQDFVNSIAGQASQYNLYDLHSQANAIFNFSVNNDFDTSQNKSPIEAFNGELLVVVAKKDHLLCPGPSVQLASKMDARILELDSDCGHYSFSCEIEKISEVVRQFLD